MFFRQNDAVHATSYLGPFSLALKVGRGNMLHLVLRNLVLVVVLLFSESKGHQCRNNVATLCCAK